MFYRVKLSNNEVLHGSIDKIAMGYQKLLKEGNLITVTSVYDKVEKCNISAVQFEKLVLKKVRTLGKIDKKFLTRLHRKSFVLSSQINNGG